ncbi:hypothetical protein ACVWXL_004243 [Bradyrhizobium sp. GM22.5]
MLQLYFSPMACSLASRIALMEAGIEARYHPVHLQTKQVVDDGSDFLGVSPKGAVPVLVLENGERLTESAAVLQYIADLKPQGGPCTRLRKSRPVSAPGMAQFRRGRDPQGVPVSNLLVQGRRLARQAACKDSADIIDACRASDGPRIPRRRQLHRRGCPSHLGFAVAPSRGNRRRAMAIVVGLSRAHAGATGRAGRDCDRNGRPQDDGGEPGVTGCHGREI